MSHRRAAAGTKDPEILAWCAVHGWLLITLDQSSMPAHLGDRLQAGQHSAGVMVVPRESSTAAMLEELVLVGVASSAEDWRDSLIHLPL